MWPARPAASERAGPGWQPQPGRPAAVLMSAEELATLEDTLELLSDPTAMAEIEHARLEVRAGRSVSADELRAKYLSE